MWTSSIAGLRSALTRCHFADSRRFLRGSGHWTVSNISSSACIKMAGSRPRLNSHCSIPVSAYLPVALSPATHRGCNLFSFCYFAPRLIHARPIICPGSITYERKRAGFDGAARPVSSRRVLRAGHASARAYIYVGVDACACCRADGCSHAGA